MSVGINPYNNYVTETGNNNVSVSKKEETTNEIKQYSSVKDYAAALSEKFDYFGKKASVYGVPTTVTVSDKFLQKCLEDPEKMEWLERNLAAVPEGTRRGENFLKSVPGSPVTTYRNIVIDENGNMSSTSGCTNDPDGKIARENALKKEREKKAKEKKEQERLEKKRAEEKELEERLAKRRTERKEQAEQLAELRAEKQEQREALQSHEVTVVGSDIQSVIEKTVDVIAHSDTAKSVVSALAGLDIKA